MQRLEDYCRHHHISPVKAGKDYELLLPAIKVVDTSHPVFQGLAQTFDYGVVKPGSILDFGMTRRLTSGLRFDQDLAEQSCLISLQRLAFDEESAQRLVGYKMNSGIFCIPGCMDIVYAPALIPGKTLVKHDDSLGEFNSYKIIIPANFIIGKL